MALFRSVIRFLMLSLITVFAGVPAVQALPSDTIRIELHDNYPLSLPGSAHQVRVDNQYVVALLADKREVFLQARGLGQSQVRLLDREGRLIEQYRVVVKADLTALRSQLKQHFPAQLISVEQQDDQLKLSGSISDEAVRDQVLALVERFLRPEIAQSGGNFTPVVDQLQLSGKAPLQLQLMIAEIPRHLISQLGADYVAVGTGNDTSVMPAGAGNEMMQAYRQQLLLSQIAAEEAKGNIKLLATADLQMRSGESVFLRAGGVFPMPASSQGELKVRDGETAADTVEQYRRFVLRPRFIAELQSDGVIQLDSEFEVSSLLATEGAELHKASQRIAPLGQTRLISRQLQLVPGQTVAFSGLLEPQLAALSRDIPGLKQLPVIGRLFDSEAYLEGFSDLVLLLTAQAPTPVKEPRQPHTKIAPQAAALYLMGHDWQPVSRTELEAPLVALPEAFERAAMKTAEGRFGHVIN